MGAHLEMAKREVASKALIFGPKDWCAECVDCVVCLPLPLRVMYPVPAAVVADDSSSLKESRERQRAAERGCGEG